MAQNIGQKLINSHLVDGMISQGTPIALRTDQTLTQDATGTLAMLSLEAMALNRVKQIHQAPGRHHIGLATIIILIVSRSRMEHGGKPRGAACCTERG